MDLYYDLEVRENVFLKLRFAQSTLVFVMPLEKYNLLLYGCATVPHYVRRA